MQTLARSLSADQRADENTLHGGVRSTHVDLVVGPGARRRERGRERRVDASWNDAAACWRRRPRTKATGTSTSSGPRTSLRSLAGRAGRETYLKQELETARSQGFDPVEKGLVIVVKKNGRVLRRLTGQPPWSSLVGTMEVADG